MRITPSAPLSKYTSFRTGGKARFFVEADSVGDIEKAINLARTEKLPHVILGEGTNVLISDGGFSGVVIRPMIRGVDISSDGFVVAGAGEHWDDVVAVTVSKKLSGLENMSLIPGSVGAAPVQNIGAYGAELKDVLRWVEIFDVKLNLVRTLSAEECNFGYRESLFKTEQGRGHIIIRVCMKLAPDGKPDISYKDLTGFFSDRPGLPTIAEVREAIINIRRAKLPDMSKLGTAGSFFKNPVISDSEYIALSQKFPDLPSFPASRGFKKIPLAWILDKICHLNGFRDGNVGIYENQPLAIVNYGKATTGEIHKFADKISALVKNKTGLAIEREVGLI